MTDGDSQEISQVEFAISTAVRTWCGWHLIDQGWRQNCKGLGYRRGKPEQMVLGINQFGLFMKMSQLPRMKTRMHRVPAVPMLDWRPPREMNTTKDLGTVSSQKSSGGMLSIIAKKGWWHYKIFVDIKKIYKSGRCLSSYYDERCQGSAKKWEKGARLRNGFRQWLQRWDTSIWKVHWRLS